MRQAFFYSFFYYLSVIKLFTMKNLNFLIAGFLALLLFSGSGCASLSQGQMKSLESFSNSCDSFKKYPGEFFEEIARIRAERGLYYAASLSDSELRAGEVGSLYSALQKDLLLAKKSNISMEVLVSYQRALKSLTADARWQDRGREFRTLGRALDSAVLRFNSLDLLEQAIPLGFGKTAGRVAGYGAELFVKRAQTRAAKEFVAQGDTLVKQVVEGLVSLLRSPGVTAMINNEKLSVKENYLSYLKSGNSVNVIADDRAYMALLERVNKLGTVRGGIISAANRLAKGHEKIAAEFQTKKPVKELYSELVEFEKEVAKLKREVENLLDGIK